jgi:hypothetical protein
VQCEKQFPEDADIERLQRESGYPFGGFRGLTHNSTKKGGY